MRALSKGQEPADTLECYRSTQWQGWQCRDCITTQRWTIGEGAENTYFTGRIMRQPEPWTAVRCHDDVYKISETTAAVVTAVIFGIL